MPITNPRIAAIQSMLGVPETGFMNLKTAQAVLQKMDKSVSSTNLSTLVKKIQTEVKAEPVDGIFGNITLTKLESYLSPKTIPMVKGATMVLSRAGLNMIVAYEVSSEDYYNKKLKSPVLPAGASGITLGIGYDLGHNNAAQIEADWKDSVNAATLKLMQHAAGLKGIAARPMLEKMKNVKIPFSDALHVYYLTTVPRYAALTRRAFPGVQNLPPDAQSAILSLVFNRGSSTSSSSDSRREMANMVPLVKAGDLKGIAKEFRSMKRLWEGKRGLRGLILRREKEAQMVENASFNILPEDQVLV